MGVDQWTGDREDKGINRECLPDFAALENSKGM